MDSINVRLLYVCVIEAEKAVNLFSSNTKREKRANISYSYLQSRQYGLILAQHNHLIVLAHFGNVFNLRAVQ
jgi:hypothetical protein